MAISWGATNIDQFEQAGIPSTSHSACGLTCVLMARKKLLPNDPLTLEQMIKASPLASGQDGLSCAELAIEAMRWGLDARIMNINPTILRGLVGQQFPILLIHAGTLPSVDDPKFTGGHFIGLNGEDDGGNPLYNNPDDSVKDGQDVKTTWAELDLAMQQETDPQYGNRTAVVIYGLLASTVIGTATVNTAVLNLHTLPVTPAGVFPVVGEIANKSAVNLLSDVPIQVEVGATEYEFVRIRTASGVVAWAASIYLTPVTVPTPTPQPAPVPTSEIRGFDISADNGLSASQIAALNAKFMACRVAVGTTLDTAYPKYLKAFFGAILAYSVGTNEDPYVQLFAFVSHGQLPGKIPVKDFEAVVGSVEPAAQAAIWIQALHDATGVYPLLYSRASYLNPLMPLPAVFENCHLWIASENHPPTLPAGAWEWDFQQDKQVNGIDSDVFSGTDLAAYMKANAVPQPTTMYTVTGLHRRLSPSLSGTVIDTLPYGTEVQVFPGRVTSTETTGEYTWTMLSAGGYVDVAYLSSVKPVPVPPPDPVITPQPTGEKFKTGFHLLDGPNTGAFLAMITRLHAAGKPLPYVTVFNDMGLAMDIKKRSPETFVTWRGNFPNPAADDYQSGYGWFTQCYLDRSTPHGMQAYEFVCEGNPNAPKFNQGMMDAANHFGVKATIGNWCVGCMPMAPFDADTTAMFKQCQEQQHFVLYHAYSSKENPQGDQDMLYQAQWYFERWQDVIAAFPDILIVLAEGLTFNATFTGPDNTMHLMKQVQTAIGVIKNIVGFGGWTIGNAGGWERSSLDPVMTAYEQWRMSFN